MWVYRFMRVLYTGCVHLGSECVNTAVRETRCGGMRSAFEWQDLGPKSTFLQPFLLLHLSLPAFPPLSFPTHVIKGLRLEGPIFGLPLTAYPRPSRQKHQNNEGLTRGTR